MKQIQNVDRMLQKRFNQLKQPLNEQQQQEQNNQDSIQNAVEAELKADGDEIVEFSDEDEDEDDEKQIQISNSQLENEEQTNRGTSSEDRIINQLNEMNTAHNLLSSKLMTPAPVQISTKDWEPTDMHSKTKFVGDTVNVPHQMSKNTAVNTLLLLNQMTSSEQLASVGYTEPQNALVVQSRPENDPQVRKIQETLHRTSKKLNSSKLSPEKREKEVSKWYETEKKYEKAFWEGYMNMSVEDRDKLYTFARIQRKMVEGKTLSNLDTSKFAEYVKTKYEQLSKKAKQFIDKYLEIQNAEEVEKKLQQAYKDLELSNSVLATFFPVHPTWGIESIFNYHKILTKSTKNVIFSTVGNVKKIM